MSLRYHLVGTILVTLLLFFWGFLVHALLHEATQPITVIEDPAEAKLVTLLDEIAPESGTYFGKHGIFLSHDMTADPSQQDATGKIDQSSEAAMGPLLMRQLIIDLVLAAFLSCIVLKIRTPGVMGKACCLGLVGLTGGIAAFVPQWSWFGFGGLLTALNILDLAGGWFVGGLVLAWLADRWVVAPAGEIR